jgi:hypothetical protein
MKRFAIAITVVAALGLCSVALAASTLSGTYKTKIHTTALGGALNGTWTIKFKSGAYTVTDNGKVVIHGKDKIKGTKITLTDASGPDACKMGSGIYKFKLKGSKLTFSKVGSDPCVGRVDVLKGKFTKVG